jgi:hypothetical protein
LALASEVDRSGFMTRRIVLSPLAKASKIASMRFVEELSDFEIFVLHSS